MGRALFKEDELDKTRKICEMVSSVHDTVRKTAEEFYNRLLGKIEALGVEILSERDLLKFLEHS